MNVYVVLARRWGSQETHSYIEGVYSKERNARHAAKIEESYRGGKYECEIFRIPVDGPGIERIKECVEGE